MTIQAQVVSRTYTGRVGCMCGCLGNYREPGCPTAARTLNEINLRIEQWLSGLDKYTFVFADDGQYIYCEDASVRSDRANGHEVMGRCMAVYFKDLF